MGDVHTKGRLKQVQTVVNFATIASLATGTAVTSKNFPIPTGSVVRSANFVIKVGFNLLTSIVIGLKIAAGTTVVANGLLAATVLAANLDTAGATNEGAGTIINGTALTAPSYVSLDVTGTTPTTGQGVLYVVYEEPYKDQTPPAVLVGVQ
jgi:hypothetical protein